MPLPAEPPYTSEFAAPEGMAPQAGRDTRPRTATLEDASMRRPREESGGEERPTFTDLRELEDEVAGCFKALAKKIDAHEDALKDMRKREEDQFITIVTTTPKVPGPKLHNEIFPKCKTELMNNAETRKHIVNMIADGRCLYVRVVDSSQKRNIEKVLQPTLERHGLKTVATAFESKKALRRAPDTIFYKVSNMIKAQQRWPAPQEAKVVTVFPIDCKNADFSFESQGVTFARSTLKKESSRVSSQPAATQYMSIKVHKEVKVAGFEVDGDEIVDFLREQLAARTYPFDCTYECTGEVLQRAKTHADLKSERKGAKGKGKGKEKSSYI